MGTQEINGHIAPQDLEGSYLPRYLFQKQKPPTLDDLLLDAKTIPSSQVNSFQGGQGPNNHLKKNLIDHLNIFKSHVQQIFQSPYKLSDLLECINV